VNNSFTYSRILWIILIVGVLGFLAWYFLSVLIYLLVAAVLSYILNPVVNLFLRIKIKGKTIPRWLAAIMSFGILIGVLAAVFALFMPILLKEVELLQAINPDRVVKTFGDQINELEVFLVDNQYTTQHNGFIMDAIKERVASVLDVANIPKIINSIVAVTGDVLFAVFAIFFMTFFMLREEHLFKKTVIDFFPDKQYQEINNSFDRIEYLLSRYFIGVLAQSTLMTILITIGISILGLENALVIGAFAGLINVIPYLGPLLGIAFGIVVGVTTNLDVIATSSLSMEVTKILLVFAIIQLLDNLIFQPIIFARSVFAHPLEIFLVVLVGAKLGGAVGMFIAIPAYTIMRVTAKEFFNSYKIVQKLTRNV